MGDACDEYTRRKLRRIRDLAGNELETYSYSGGGYLLTRITHLDAVDAELHTAYQYDALDKLTSFVETPSNAPGGPRTTQLVYDENGHYIGALSDGCGCAGQNGNTFVYQDAQNRVVKITTAETPPESATVLELFTYTHGLLSTHQKRNAEGSLVTVEQRTYDFNCGDGCDHIALVCLSTDVASHQVRKDYFDDQGRLFKLQAYAELQASCDDPGGTAGVDFFETNYTYESTEEGDSGRLISETRETIDPSGVKQVSKWYICVLQDCDGPNDCEADPYTDGSVKYVESYTTYSGSQDTVSQTSTR